MLISSLLQILGKKQNKNNVFKENLQEGWMTTKSLRLNRAQHEPNYDNEKLDDDIYVVQELTRAIHHSRSVYIITENGADIKFTGLERKYSRLVY